MTVLREVRPDLWLTELTLEEFDVRGAVVRGRDRALVWDSLSHPRDMAPVSDLLGELPYVLVYSHADWDHVWGTAGLPDVQTVVAHDACLRRFHDDAPETLAQMRAEQPGRWDDVRLIPPTVTFSQRLTMDLGGVTVELHHLSGHTQDCLVAFIPAWGILLGGDAVEEPFPLVNDGTVLADWAGCLQTWAGDPRVQMVIPCHGAIGDRGLLQANVTYLTALSRGDDPVVSTQGSAFYDTSHDENVAKVRAARVVVRASVPADRPGIDAIILQEWGDPVMVVSGEQLTPAQFPGFVAVRDEKIVGLITYRLLDDRCQVLVLNCLEPGQGIGRRLLQAVAETARRAGKERMTVVTSNDNMPALRLYQLFGMHIASIRPGMILRSRALKPAIPQLGLEGIPIRDEIELELRLS